MSFPKHLGAYTDLAALLDQAIEAGGAAIEFDSRKAKIRWRQRAYTFRSIHRKALPPGAICKYDALEIVDDPDKIDGFIVRFRAPNAGMITFTPLKNAQGPRLSAEEKMAQDLLAELGGKK